MGQKPVTNLLSHTAQRPKEREREIFRDIKRERDTKIAKEREREWNTIIMVLSAAPAPVYSHVRGGTQPP